MSSRGSRCNSVWSFSQVVGVYSALYNGGMHDLGKLFGSPARLRLLRLFALNPEAVWDRDDVVKRTRIAPDTVSKELAQLGRAGFLKRKGYYREVAGANGKVKKRRATGWALEQGYPYLTPLTAFLTATVSVSVSDIRRRLRPAGPVRLLILSGMFTRHADGVLDLLIVGDRLNEVGLSTALKQLEIELGRELRYAVLSTEDYLLRRRVRDKLVRDVLDYEHEVLIDKLSG